MTDIVTLAKNLDYKKIEWPALVSEKIDGVACRIDITNLKDMAQARTRQGEVLLSVGHITRELVEQLSPVFGHITVFGELHIPGAPFKVSSGAVRSYTNRPDIRLGIYDVVSWAHMSCDYFAYRYEMIRRMLPASATKNVFCIPQHEVRSVQEFETYRDIFMKDHPDAEGLMVRQCYGPASEWKAGRSWGFQRWKPADTLDGVLMRIHPAGGEHAGMAGRLDVSVDGEVFGIGPGKLTHAQRKDMFEHPGKYLGKWLEFKAKPDKTYDKKREPTFFRFRPDKDVWTC